MKRKNERTLDVYKEAGAYMRLLKTLGAKTATKADAVLASNETDKILRALDVIKELCSCAEERMFKDHPQIGSDYIDVFYGCLSMTPKNAVDKEVIERAKRIASELSL